MSQQADLETAPPQPTPSSPVQRRGVDRRDALRSLARSLAINALCPFLLYRALQSRYPVGSITPLLWATVFPVIGLILGLVRKRAVDAIAIIAMVGLALHIVTTILARTVGIALIVRSLDGAVIGLVFLVSTVIRHPLTLVIAKQTVTGSARTQFLDRMTRTDGLRMFYTTTLVWGICLILMSGVHIVLALDLQPATFLLASPLLGAVTIVALLVWTGRYARSRIGSGS